MSEPLVERTALKEWAVLIDAMDRGEIWAMVRKGGIREQRAGFAVRHDHFLLYPTYFHEKESELAPRFRDRLDASRGHRPPDGVVRFAHVATVAAMWWVTDLASLRPLDNAWGLDWTAVESRFHYRDRPGVHVIAVDVRRLAQPVDVPEARRYGGCVSWVELDRLVSVADAQPVLSSGELRCRVATLEDALGVSATC